MNFEIDGIPIELTRKSIKNVNLRIYPPHGLVKVSAPLCFSEQKIRRFLQEKSPWIHRQRALINTRFLAAKETTPPENHLAFKGNNYLLMITFHHGPAHITINEDTIYCYAPEGYEQNQIEQLIDTWYRRELCELLPKLFAHWEAIIGVSTKEWGIKKMKTRWGSCNTQAKRIWLNLNLIKKPTICLEYVLVHELVHLLEASHNKRFYQLMTQFMPQWRSYKTLLEN